MKHFEAAIKYKFIKYTWNFILKYLEVMIVILKMYLITHFPIFSIEENPADNDNKTKYNVRLQKVKSVVS